jgi:hypothetical protein
MEHLGWYDGARARAADQSSCTSVNDEGGAAVIGASDIFPGTSNREVIATIAVEVLARNTN